MAPNFRCKTSLRLLASVLISIIVLPSNVVGQISSLSIVGSIQPMYSISSISNGLNSGSLLVPSTYSEKSMNGKFGLEYKLGLAYSFLDRNEISVTYSSYYTAQKYYSGTKKGLVTFVSEASFYSAEMKVQRLFQISSRLKFSTPLGLVFIFDEIRNDQYLINSQSDYNALSVDYVRNFSTLSGLSPVAFAGINFDYALTSKLRLCLDTQWYLGFRNLYSELVLIRAAINGQAAVVGYGTGINKGDKIAMELGFRYAIHRSTKQ